MAVNYVKLVLGFWGITNPETVVIEGHNQYSDRTEDNCCRRLRKSSTISKQILIDCMLNQYDILSYWFFHADFSIIRL